MEDKFIIRGISGKRSLKGKIRVNGAKNAILKGMAASILFNTPVKFENTPAIEDVNRMEDLLRELGARITHFDNNSFSIDSVNISKTDLLSDIGKNLRASIVLSGPILARFGKVSFPHPGGCVIGARPINLFLDGFEKMGAKVIIKNQRGTERYEIAVPKGRLRAAELFFRTQSITATETFMMAGVLAKGETVIKNAALEPEIIHLAEFLNNSGANIIGAGTPTIRIKGGRMLTAKEKYITPPDRIEAGSFIILSALAGLDVTVTDCEPRHIESLLEIMSYAGVKFDTSKNSVRITSSGLKRKFKAVSIKTHEYPGFPTDLQAPMVVFLTQAEGESLVFETIFEGRLAYVESLKRMGADITTMDPHRILVRGPSLLRGRELESPDLRAGLAFIIAGIISNGESVIGNVYNIDRGYERVEERLRGLGVDIVRISA